MATVWPWLDYPLLKTLHILSSVLLFGTGFGTYFFMMRAMRSRNTEAIRVTARSVVMADWWFTAPAALIQPLTGGLLMQRLQISWYSGWFFTVATLFVLVGALWLPVVWIQLKLDRELSILPHGASIPESLWRWMRVWQWLGYPAFLSGPFLFALMVYKPWLS